MEAKQKIASFKRMAFSKFKSNSHEAKSPNFIEVRKNTRENLICETKNNVNHKNKVSIKEMSNNSFQKDKSKTFDKNLSLSPTGLYSKQFWISIL